MVVLIGWILKHKCIYCDSYMTFHTVLQHLHLAVGWELPLWATSKVQETREQLLSCGAVVPLELSSNNSSSSELESYLYCHCISCHICRADIMFLPSNSDQKKCGAFFEVSMVDAFRGLLNTGKWFISMLLLATAAELGKRLSVMQRSEPFWRLVFVSVKMF